VGSLVVNAALPLGRKVAEVYTADDRRGYLLIIPDGARSTDGRSSLIVDLQLVLQSPFNGDRWEFSDRADPEPEYALQEMRDGVFEWYGNRLYVRRWLDGEERRQIVDRFFA
jgi:hypothetical protein